MFRESLRCKRKTFTHRELAAPRDAAANWIGRACYCLSCLERLIPRLTSLFAPLRVPLFSPLVLSVLERLVAVLLRGVLAPVPASVPTAKTFCELKSRSGGIPIDLMLALGVAVPLALPPACAYVITDRATTNAEAKYVLANCFMMHLPRSYLMQASPAYMNYGPQGSASRR